MPHYFFDVNDGRTFHRDLDGEEVSDLKDAHKIALRCLPEILNIRFAHDAQHQDVTITVRDSSGATLLTVCLSVYTKWSNEF